MFAVSRRGGEMNGSFTECLCNVQKWLVLGSNRGQIITSVVMKYSLMILAKEFWK